MEIMLLSAVFNVVGRRILVKFLTFAAHDAMYVVDHAIAAADVTPAHALAPRVARM